jgi:hypothetical protein
VNVDTRHEGHDVAVAAAPVGGCKLVLRRHCPTSLTRASCSVTTGVEGSFGVR